MLSACHPETAKEQTKLPLTRPPLCPWGPILAWPPFPVLGVESFFFFFFFFFFFDGRVPGAQALGLGSTGWPRPVGEVFLRR